MFGVTGRKPEAFIGPFNSQSLSLKAIQFIMIVLITSCDPKRAFNSPGIAPHIPPAAMAAATQSGTSTTAGHDPSTMPTHAVANAAM